MFKPALYGIFVSLAAFAGSAQAAIVDVTYIGTLTGGTDVGGNFGAPGTDLFGQTITVDYKFNTDLGDVVSASGSHSASGGSLFSNTSPSLGVTILIGSGSLSFDGGEYGYISENVTGSTTYQAGATSTSGNDVHLFLETAGVVPDSIVTPFSATSSGSSSGRFDLADGSFGNFAVTSLTETVSAVPLPAGLPLFGFGLLSVGALGFMRKRGGLIGR